MRSCSTDRGLRDCTECGAGAACSHSELLDHMRAGARDVGLKVKTEAGSADGLIETWTAELRETWPTCMLFPEDE